jgi:hypothetical protein
LTPTKSAIHFLAPLFSLYETLPSLPIVLASITVPLSLCPPTTTLDNAMVGTCR